MSSNIAEDSILGPELASLAERVIRENAAAGRKVTVAESCTGGLVSAALTEVPGSSAVFERGFVTYSNEAKMQMLDVPADIIETFGAVSIACVWSMAQGALLHSNADVAVAISGIAGPGGGSDLKPVGTVVFAYATREGGVAPDGELKRFADNGRSSIRREAALCALELLMPPAED